MRARAVQPMLHPLFWAFPFCFTLAPANGCEVPPPEAPQPPVSIGAVHASQDGVITGLQDQVLSRSISQEDEPAGAGAEFPSGRLGEAWHGAYINLQPSHWPSYNSQTAEESFLGSGFYKLPQSVFGGGMQVGAFGGEDLLRTSYRLSSPSPGTLLGTNASSHSYIFGGYILYNFNKYYLMNTISIFDGTIEQTGSAFANGSSSFGAHGFVNTAVAGHVFDLNGTARSLQMDVRGGLLYSNAYGDPFSDRDGQIFHSSTDEWTASLSLTLFRDLALPGDETVRPYVKAGLKEQLGYSNRLEESVEGADATYRFGQSGTLGSAEIGLDYVRSNVTFTGGLYGEAATDRSSLGGRLGAKLAF